MKRQSIWKTSVTATNESEDAVMELLASLVAPGPSAYTDAETGVTTVSAYSTTPPKSIAKTKTTLRSRLARLTSYGINAGTMRVSVVKLPAENWADSWKRHFSPLEIGATLLVKPSWSKWKPRKNQALVVLDPGLSFGTGQHPTTEFCLREIVRAIRKKPLSLLDIGTGSGILAIAATKLGYSPVHAFDFDPQCVRVSRANAHANRVDDRIRITRSDLTSLPRRSAERYDVVCANLLADLLMAERDRILARLKPDGVLVVAGILKREFSEVQHTYESAGLQLVASRVEREWRSGAFQFNR